jgi:hypothetical protein
MAIKEVKLPLYDTTGEDTRCEVTIKEFAGRLVFQVCTKEGGESVDFLRFECYLDDIQRAWQAVRRI